MLNILIADDSEVVRQLLKTAFSGERGWSLCEQATDGQQAISLARQWKPDLIVMDLAMPLLDGLHASAEILKFAPGLPIVLYTLHNTPEIALEAKKAGISAVVSKSDNMSVLVDTIKRLMPEIAGVSPLATISNELFTGVAAPEASDGATAETAAPGQEPATGEAAIGNASRAAAAATSVGAAGDTASPEVEPPSKKISEPPPGVS